MNPTPRVVYFERWPHPVAHELIAERDRYEVQCLSLDAPHEEVWAAFAKAHVYQIRASRSELPPEFFGHAEFLARCPELLAISSSGSGFDTIEVAACTEAGVLAVNQAGGNKEAVAEHALAMILSLSKRIVEADRAMRRAPGLNREDYMGHDVIGQTLGIVGLGNIGTRLAELAGGLLRMKVIAYDPYLSDAEFAERGAEPVDLETLMSESDFVSVHCPRTAESEYMIDAGALARMKRGAYFVNTARGGIHDEAALHAALAGGAIAGAGLDVWEDEPPPVDHPLLALDNVIASPHTAGVTHEARRNIVTGTIEQIDVILAGARAPRILNPQAWDHYVERFEQILGMRPA